MKKVFLLFLKTLARQWPPAEWAITRRLVKPEGRMYLVQTALAWSCIIWGFYAAVLAAGPDWFGFMMITGMPATLTAQST